MIMFIRSTTTTTTTTKQKIYMENAFIDAALNTFRNFVHKYVSVFQKGFYFLAFALQQQQQQQKVLFIDE